MLGWATATPGVATDHVAADQKETMETARTRAATELVEQAQGLVAAGVPRREAATKLAGLAPDRHSLQGAHVSWVRLMHRLPSDDYDSTNVLRLLEAALSQLPRTSAIGASAQT